MKVLFDTNILISYLLQKDKNNTITAIFEAGIEKKYILLLPEEILKEFKEKLIKKKYLIKYISLPEANEFIEILSTISEAIPQITEEIPLIVRDKKDDYLIAYGTVGNADYLVSGDKDLQVLKKIGKLKIVSPIEFLTLLRRL